MRPAWLGCATALALFSGAGEAGAQARIPTCVEVIVGSGDASALRRLVESELDRHPTHQAARAECTSFLRVELIELDSIEGGGRYLTARINEQVPQREAVDGRGLATALERLLTVVLHNDPLRLRGPRKENWLDDQSRAFVAGRTYFGVEAFQLFTPLRENFQSLPGAALSMRRETPRWYLGMRLGGALSPMPDSSQTELVLWVRTEIEATAFASPRANTSFFGALLLGAEYQRFRGPAPRLGPEARGSAVGAGFSPGLRAGIELFRVTGSRVTIFAQVALPAFVSTDPDAGVVDEWLPTAGIGAGAVL